MVINVNFHGLELNCPPSVVDNGTVVIEQGLEVGEAQWINTI